MPDERPDERPGTKVETEVTGRDRLIAALTGRPSKGQVTAGVLLGVLGFAGVVQVHANNQHDIYAGASQQDLISLINQLQLATDRAESQISDLVNTRDALRSDTQASELALNLARKQAASLGILAGTVPAIGPGVVVTVDGPPASIGTRELVNGIQELRDAGAEAMQLNKSVRLVGESSISDGTGDTVIVDGRQISPPFVIEAIGSPSALNKAVFFREGFAFDVRKTGGDVKVKELDRIEIATTRTVSSPQYAKPTS